MLSSYAWQNLLEFPFTTNCCWFQIHTLCLWFDIGPLIGIVTLFVQVLSHVVAKVSLQFYSWQHHSWMNDPELFSSFVMHFLLRTFSCSTFFAFVLLSSYMILITSVPIYAFICGSTYLSHLVDWAWSTTCSWCSFLCYLLVNSWTSKAHSFVHLRNKLSFSCKMKCCPLSNWCRLEGEFWVGWMVKQGWVMSLEQTSVLDS